MINLESTHNKKRDTIRVERQLMIKNAIENGEYPVYVAKDYNIKITGVSRVIKKYNLTARIAPFDEKEARILYKEGVTIHTIANHFFVNKGKVKESLGIQNTPKIKEIISNINFNKLNTIACFP